MYECWDISCQSSALCMYKSIPLIWKYLGELDKFAKRMKTGRMWLWYDMWIILILISIICLALHQTGDLSMVYIAWQLRWASALTNPHMLIITQHLFIPTSSYVICVHISGTGQTHSWRTSCNLIICNIHCNNRIPHEQKH